MLFGQRNKKKLFANKRREGKGRRIANKTRRGTRKISNQMDEGFFTVADRRAAKISNRKRGGEGDG